MSSCFVGAFVERSLVLWNSRDRSCFLLPALRRVVDLPFAQHNSDKNFSIARNHCFSADHRLRWAEKENFEPPDARIGSPSFSNSYKLALLNKIVKQGGQKPENK